LIRHQYGVEGGIIFMPPTPAAFRRSRLAERPCLCGTLAQAGLLQVNDTVFAQEVAAFTRRSALCSRDAGCEHILIFVGHEFKNFQRVRGSPWRGHLLPLAAFAARDDRDDENSDD